MPPIIFAQSPADELPRSSKVRYLISSLAQLLHDRHSQVDHERHNLNLCEPREFRPLASTSFAYRLRIVCAQVAEITYQNHCFVLIQEIAVFSRRPESWRIAYSGVTPRARLHAKMLDS